MLVVVNYAPYTSQCYARLPFDDLAQKACQLQDLCSGTVLERPGGDLLAKGLYLDEPAWKYYVFLVTPR